MNFIKKNFVLLLAFSLPVVLVLVVALSVYLPSRFLSTRYDFVYTACTDGATMYYYNCGHFTPVQYEVRDGKLGVVPVDPQQDANGNGVPDVQEQASRRLFLHDTKKNESTEITLDQAKALQLSGLLTSPDGVLVSSGYSSSGDFLLFGGGSTYGYYLTKGKAKSELHLIGSANRSYYDRDFQFVGWVLPGRN